MKNKLFRSIFSVAMAVFVLCFVIFVIVLYFRMEDISVTGQESPLLLLLVEMILPFVLILLAAILLSVYLASKVANDITVPIVRIDPDRPDERGMYEELLPFIEKLRMQNNQVRLNIEQIKLEHEKQDEMRREFTANVSHELKTPLTSILGTAEILENGLVKPEDVAHFSGNIRKEAQRLISLVNDIIELSRLDENAISPEKETVDLYLLSKDIAASLSLSAKTKNVTVSVEGEMVEIEGHAKILHEMIYNLTDNAIKYNREGGTVAIKTRKDNGFAYVSVADTGIGIPEGDIPRIFERFYRVDKSHSKEIGGTGLGLSIVKHGAKLHGATIDLESHLNKGTTITLKFPLI